MGLLVTALNESLVRPRYWPTDRVVSSGCTNLLLILLYIYVVYYLLKHTSELL